MVKPLRSDEPKPVDVQFRDFGVLDTGARSKGAAATSIIVNGAILALVLIAGAIVKANPEIAKNITPLMAPPPPPDPPKPKTPPPPPPKPLPTPPRVQPPKITPPVKPIEVEVPKPVPPVPHPAPVITPPAPKAVTPPAAPAVVKIARPTAASIANNDPHPTAVRMGNPEIKALNGPPVATPVNLGGGMHGMPASNTGSGPASVSINHGSGAPGGSVSGHDAGPAVISGLRRGVPGGTGSGPAGPQQVAIVHVNPAVQPATVTQPTPATMTTPPKCTYQPVPAYTEQARAAHLEGSVALRIRITAGGAVQVLSVVRGLGSGLDESAQRAAAGMRFTPAKNAAGQSIDYETTINVRFQMS